ncbi:integrase core domain-containing protein [Duganella sp. HH105]|uniref:integrase core domain-containing protein n=1 Tax=Duganella sp. HH105 TaxID=1781067 RepID=UPI000877CA64|nr:integrase core domain-containing protein [Duganella sp. HH105]OEZ52861.1 integrase core domain protein [Duganella sp. HH105]
MSEEFKSGLKAAGFETVHFIFGIIDHGTRLNIALVRMVEQTSEALLYQVLLAIEAYGQPRRIKTDNASVFRSRVFSGTLAALGIRHVFSGRGKPWQNGRIERLNLTLKKKLNLRIPRDGLLLDGMLKEFRFWYNEIRPHQHLHGHTPGEAWRGVNPYLRRPVRAIHYSGWNGLLTGWDLRG